MGAGLLMKPGDIAFKVTSYTDSGLTAASQSGTATVVLT
jgi:hypothetical protein